MLRRGLVNSLFYRPVEMLVYYFAYTADSIKLSLCRPSYMSINLASGRRAVRVAS